MLPFEPLVRIARTAFPYWLIVLVLMTLLTAFVAQRKEKRSFWGYAIFHSVSFCGFVFIVLGIYVQLTSRRMSFVTLLPSSLLVGLAIGLLFSAGALLLARSEKEQIHPAMLIVMVVLTSLLSGVFLAFVVSVFPPFIAAHFT